MNIKPSLGIILVVLSFSAFPRAGAQQANSNTAPTLSPKEMQEEKAKILMAEKL